MPETYMGNHLEKWFPHPGMGLAYRLGRKEMRDMKKGLIAAALSTLALGSACTVQIDEAGSETVGTATEALQECTRNDKTNPLDYHLAALATEVLKCNKALTPHDFVVNRKTMLLGPGPALEKCQDEFRIQNIKNLLGLQGVKESRANPYFAQKWLAWRERLPANLLCPSWEEVQEIDPATIDNTKASMECLVRQKSKFEWRIRPPEDCRQSPKCAVTRALICSGWIGEVFHVTQDYEKGLATTDPSWWKDNTPYPPSDPWANPFYFGYGYQHQMATEGIKPGDVYGALNRAGELCNKWTADLSGVQWNRVLTPIDCGGGWYCLTQCM
jgi:hypothetical protein